MSVAASERSAVNPSPLRGGPRIVSGLESAADSISDIAVIAFAIWTVLYHVGLIFHIATNPLLVVWLILSIAASVVVLGRVPGAATPATAVARLARQPVIVIPTLAVISALLIVSHRSAIYWLGWVIGLVIVLIGLVSLIRARIPDDTAVADLRSALGTLVAIGSAIGLGVFSLFTLRSDPDDTFYVNRSVWVAQHGTIPTRDTMFGSQTLHSLPGAGIPVGSIETFQGAIAHVFGIAGGSAAYLITPPVATALAVWSIWRLIRAWAPRRLVLCLITALTYLIWAAKDGGNLGVFFLARIQQGKVIFVAMLIPLLFLYLTRYVSQPSRRTEVLLFASGVAAIGYTSSSTFLVPLICVTAAGPLVLQRRFRLAAGAMLPAVYPILVGVVVHFSSATVDNFGKYWTSEPAFHFVFGSHWFSAIGWFGVLVGVLFARTYAAKLISWGIAAMLVVLLAPGMFSVLNTLTGAHAVVWRVMWVAPVPVMVGLLAALPTPSWARWAAPVPAAVVMLAVIVVGLPLWSGQRSVKVESSPTWRYSQTALRAARAIIKAHPNGGPILAPDSTMRAITLSTTRVHAVDPLRSYVNVLVEPADQHRARILLSNAIDGRSPMPSAAATRNALQILHVSVVCVQPSWTNRRELFEQAGYDQAKTIGGEICLTPSGTN